jgi:hypothetical protein
MWIFFKSLDKFIIFVIFSKKMVKHDYFGKNWLYLNNSPKLHSTERFWLILAKLDYFGQTWLT